MNAGSLEQEPEPLSLVGGGPTHRVAEYFGLAHPTFAKRLIRVALLILVTWVPLVVLSFIAGDSRGDTVRVPLLRDIEVYVRFLVVLPLLELAEVVMALSMRVQARHLVESGIVPERERERFLAAGSSVTRWRRSLVAEVVLLVLSYVISIGLRMKLGLSAGDSSWERNGPVVTLPGWWYMLISLPFLYFFLLRWIWVFLLWASFLFRVSRLDLELTATHPDRTGGLGFVGWGMASFATLLLAFSSTFSAGFADEILNHGESIDSLKYHVMVFIGVALVILHLPLFAFSGRLSRCRFTGLLEFGALVWRHDRAFDEKWLGKNSEADADAILGSPDVGTLADIATCYEHVDRMWPIPFDSKAFAILVAAALVPMVPLLGTKIPLTEIFMKLGEMLV